MRFNVYKGSINLCKFLDARVIVDEDDNGIAEKGIFIPIEKNNLYTRDGNVYLSLFIFPTIKAKFKAVSHFITQYVSASHYDKLKSLGYRAPFLGYMKFHDSKMWGERFKATEERLKQPLLKRPQIKYVQIDEK